MPLRFATGAIANALRRGLRINGPFDSQVDETLVPVVQVRDLTVPPFRASGKVYQRDFTAAGGAGITEIRITNPGPNPVILRRVTGAVSVPAAVVIGLRTPIAAFAAFTALTDLPLATSEEIPQRGIGELPVDFSSVFLHPENLGVFPTLIEFWRSPFLAISQPFDTGVREWVIPSRCIMNLATTVATPILQASVEVQQFDDLPLP